MTLAGRRSGRRLPSRSGYQTIRARGEATVARSHVGSPDVRGMEVTGAACQRRWAARPMLGQHASGEPIYFRRRESGAGSRRTQRLEISLQCEQGWRVDDSLRYSHMKSFCTFHLRLADGTPSDTYEPFATFVPDFSRHPSSFGASGFLGQARLRLADGQDCSPSARPTDRTGRTTSRDWDVLSEGLGHAV